MNRNYWTKEKCIEEALKYTSRSEFQKKSKGSYVACYKNGWLDIVCEHMSKIRHEKGYWTKERCLEEALKYKNIKDFQNKSRSAYGSSFINGWLDDFFKKVKIMKKGYWTKERCLEEALKYKTRSDFRKESRKAYSISVKNGWLDFVCENLPGSKPKNYWTKERCLEEALKYDTRVDFEKGSTSACLISRKKLWMDEICKHMRPIGNAYSRCIYAIEFPDNHVYIGLSYNPEKRFKNHIKESINNKSSVYKYFIKTGLYPSLKIITDYMSIDYAPIMENMKKMEYEKNGWNILNIAKCGALGSNRLIWTKEKCIEESLKYSTKKEFKINSPSAWNSCQRNGWLSDIKYNL